MQVQAIFGDFIGEDRLVAIGKAGRILEFDLTTGVEVSRFEGMKYATSISASPSGNKIAIATSDDKCVIFTRSGEPHTRFKIPSEMNRIAWSPDGTLVAMAFHRSHLSVYDAESGKEVRRVAAEWVPRVESVGTQLVLVQGVLSDDMRSNFQLLNWDLEPMKEAAELPPCPNHWGIRPDFSSVWASYNDIFRIHEVANRNLTEIPIPPGVTASSLAMHPNQDEISLVSSDGEVYRIQTQTGAVLSQVSHPFANHSQYSPAGNRRAVFGMKTALID